MLLFSKLALFFIQLFSCKCKLTSCHSDVHGFVLWVGFLWQTQFSVHVNAKEWGETENR